MKVATVLSLALAGAVLETGLNFVCEARAAEPYRPHFHFTPAKNWMNDPNGMLYYEGEYHLFYQYNPFGDKWGHMSWGHAVSKDLVHWEHLPVALLEEDGVMIFSGSAVVDWKNTSGFGQGGKPPLVAIYTGHLPGRNRQYQAIAFSNDKGRTWTKFSSNPVLDIGAQDFRDPKVHWNEQSKQWVMTVAMPVERKIRFYGSPDLKSWKYLSEFGPAGSTSGIWECPDLFELPIEGKRDKRWVLIVNIGSGSVAGGSGGQYFIGHFDGTKFVPDLSGMNYVPEQAPEGVLLNDFESDSYGEWKVTGDAFGSGPAKGTLANQNTVSGYQGERLVNSYHRGDSTRGTLTSPAFNISQPYLNFLIGGGAHKETCMNLLVDGKVVRTASGRDDERLAWSSWDVREFRGQSATIQIMDQHTGGWGHINVDQITLASAPARSATEPALWVDYGKDFYAAVSWSDIPKRDGRRLWLGWMSNWEYAGDVPTSPWRSAMSVARELTLHQTPEGLKLAQTPVRELEKLRRDGKRFRGGDVEKANTWLQKNQVEGDRLELIVEFEPRGSSQAGIKLFKGPSEEAVITADTARGLILVDRTNAGNSKFHPRFPGVHEAPLKLEKGKVRWRILVDTCSIELFANDGQVVLTDLVFPTEQGRGVELFGPADMRVESLRVWRMDSALPVAAKNIENR